ncbi:MAG: ribulose-phosphate 3-epimerase [Chloroflexi bacterium]|nr:ribulose-phosphate 3-epimerase [Chloroflexota bacterium]MBM3172625.1 ribulose-phosphate 3-epimerase [Chloroflexota bacterium]MBM3174218.1 ribulose-phosphate 3-epimerase [Chloroflexota bacterium]MBM4449889.1 ribulose-phosphate 3-epimerase [Chloroflexota bacterium]
MLKKRIKLAPSILSADFSRLGEQIAEVAAAGADYIHVDVMDGHFVPNITIGAPVVASLHPKTNLPLDVHLMIEQPEKHISQFAQAGADIITVHVEVSQHLHRLIEMIKNLGAKAGVALNPATPISAIDEVLPMLDLVLIMTVNPGFGGQTFIEGTMDKIVRMRKKLDDINAKVELEVDGGINTELSVKVAQAGADVLVAGSAIFNAKQDAGTALRNMRIALKSPS